MSALRSGLVLGSDRVCTTCIERDYVVATVMCSECSISKPYNDHLLYIVVAYYQVLLNIDIESRLYNSRIYNTYIPYLFFLEKMLFKV